MRRSAADFHGFFRRQWIVIGIKNTEEAGVEPTKDANAPSNGFEARGPHRERYSSGVEHAAVSAAAEEALRRPRRLRAGPERRGSARRPGQAAASRARRRAAREGGSPSARHRSRP